HSGDDHRPWHLRNADDGRHDPGGARFPGSGCAFPATSGTAAGVRGAGAPYHREPNAEWRSDPSRRSAAHCCTLRSPPMQQDPAVIVGSTRTTIGALQGELAGVPAPQLGATAIRAAVERSGLPAEAVQEILMGCVLPAGLGQAPARQAALGAGLAKSTVCTTLNKMCGSGMQAAILGHDLLRAGSVDVVVAGGMESMSNAPYLLDGARQGLRMGHGRMLDHMFL